MQKDGTLGETESKQEVCEVRKHWNQEQRWWEQHQPTRAKQVGAVVLVFGCWSELTHEKSRIQESWSGGRRTERAWADKSKHSSRPRKWENKCCWSIRSYSARQCVAVWRREPESAPSCRQTYSARTSKRSKPTTRCLRRKRSKTNVSRNEAHHHHLWRERKDQHLKWWRRLGLQITDARAVGRETIPSCPSRDTHTTTASLRCQPASRSSQGVSGISDGANVSERRLGRREAVVQFWAFHASEPNRCGTWLSRQHDSDYSFAHWCQTIQSRIARESRWKICEISWGIGQADPSRILQRGIEITKCIQKPFGSPLSWKRRRSPRTRFSTFEGFLSHTDKPLDWRICKNCGDGQEATQESTLALEDSEYCQI